MDDRLLNLLVDLRYALGDNGARMQRDLVEYAKQIKAKADEADALREALVLAQSRLVPLSSVVVGLHGDGMYFSIGNQYFRLAYAPTEPAEFDFMRCMLLSAFSRLVASAPAPQAHAGPGASGADSGMPGSAAERHLRRLLCLRAGMAFTYWDDGGAQGTEHGISIDFMREPVADIDAKLCALNVARAACPASPEPDEPEGSVCARCGALAFDPVLPQQAEPLNLRDPAVQKRLAAQWGYVPASAQAEPDLSRCPQCNGPADNGHDRSIPPNPYLCTKCMSEPAEPVAQQAKPLTGLDMFLDPNDGLKPKPYMPHAEPDLRFANPIGLTPSQKEMQRRQLAQQAEPVQDLYWRLHSLSKVLEGSGRIDQHDHPDAYATILDAMVMAQQADKPQRPKCLEFALDFLGTPENGELLAYIEQLEARAALAQQTEPVAWGVDWGRDGDRACVSIFKKRADGSVEIVAVEYRPDESAPPQRKPLTEEVAALTAQRDALLGALKEAATSLETVGRLAGKSDYLGDDGERIPTYMGRHDEVREYATSRAGVARAAIKAVEGGA